MRVTTDLKAALADKGNRAVAYAQLLQQDPDLINESPEQIAEWVDDIIVDWVDELERDLNAGCYPDNYNAQYQSACGYWD